MKIGEQIWKIVARWSFFEKDTIGKQWVRAADSIAANISEGFGRFHYKENKNFNYYSRGSLYETKTWALKAFNRKLTTEDEFTDISGKLKDLSVKLNNYLNTIGK